MSKFFFRRRKPLGPWPSAGYLLEWAGFLTALFLIANIAGLRQFTSVLNGTIGSSTLDWQTASFLGAAYVLVYLAFVLGAPTLIIAAGILKLLQKVAAKKKPPMKNDKLKWIKWLTWFFIFGLVVSGATAIPLKTELDAVAHFLGAQAAGRTSGFAYWILRVRDALHDTYGRYPFFGYGFDWLAFGHFAIAIAFIGALRDPVRNRWLYLFGMIACVLVIPYAIICGGLRGIPFYWRLIDCSFGVFGFIPLYLCWRWTGELERA